MKGNLQKILSRLNRARLAVAPRGVRGGARARMDILSSRYPPYTLVQRRGDVFRWNTGRLNPLPRIRMLSYAGRSFGVIGTALVLDAIEKDVLRIFPDGAARRFLVLGVTSTPRTCATELGVVAKHVDSETARIAILKLVFALENCKGIGVLSRVRITERQ